MGGVFLVSRVDRRTTPCAGESLSYSQLTSSPLRESFCAAMVLT
jgi:hypothetical protein